MSAIDPESKLPCVRLSEHEKEIYAYLYDLADTDKDGWVGPNEAVAFFSKCANLNMTQLGQIWDVVNVNGAGKLNRNSFATALRLICLVQQGRTATIEEVVRSKDIPLPQLVGVSIPQTNGGQNSEWVITPSYKKSCSTTFTSIPKAHPSFLTGDEARGYLAQSGLQLTDLAMIWALADVDKDGKLSLDEFTIALFLIHAKLANRQLPATLPPTILQTYKSTHAIEGRAEEVKQLGDESFTKGDLDGAERYYTAAIDKALVQLSSIYRHRASVKFAQNLIHDAISDCSTALQYNPKYAKSYLQRSHCYLHLGEFQKAQTDVDKAFEIDPQDESIITHMQRIKQAKAAFANANIKLKKEQWEEALESYKLVVGFCPQSVEAQYGYAEASVRLGKHVEAKAAVSIILAHYPDHVGAAWLRCLITYNTADIAVSQEAVKSFLKLDSQHSEALTLKRKLDRLHDLKERGNDAFTRKNFQEAIDAFSDALKERELPSEYSAILYANRAAAYKILHQYDEAIGDLSKSIEINKNYVKAYVRRAQCYAELELWEEAATDYSTVVSFEPFNTESATALRIAQQKASEVKQSNYYTLLGVTPQSTSAQIKKAYHVAALKYHPDKVNSGAGSALKSAKVFKEINKAYEILSDPQKKQQYDFELTMRHAASSYAASAASSTSPFGASPFGGAGGPTSPGASPFGAGNGFGNASTNGGFGFSAGAGASAPGFNNGNHSAGGFGNGFF